MKKKELSVSRTEFESLLTDRVWGANGVSQFNAEGTSIHQEKRHAHYKAHGCNYGTA